METKKVYQFDDKKIYKGTLEHLTTKKSTKARWNLTPATNQQAVIGISRLIALKLRRPHHRKTLHINGKAVRG